MSITPECFKKTDFCVEFKRDVYTTHPFTRRFRCVRFFAVRKSNKQSNRDPSSCNHSGCFTWHVLLVCARFLQPLSLLPLHRLYVLCFWFLIVYVGCYCWAQRRKKRCKVDVGHVFFQKFNRDVLFVSLVEITIVFPPAKHALQNSVSLNAFAPKVRTSAVIVEHSQ